MRTRIQHRLPAAALVFFAVEVAAYNIDGYWPDGTDIVMDDILGPPCGTQSEFSDNAQFQMSEWNEVDTTDNSHPFRINLDPQCYFAAADGRNTIGFLGEAELMTLYGLSFDEALGWTVCWSDDGIIYECDVIFDEDLPWQLGPDDDYWFQSTAQSLLGKVRGLDDYNDYLSMQNTGQSSYLRDEILYMDDKEGVRQNASFVTERDIVMYNKWHDGVNPQWMSMDPTRLRVGETIDLRNITVENRGTLSFDSELWFGIYLSTNDVVSTGDTLLNEGVFDSFGRFSFSTFDWSATIPASVTDCATRFIGGVIDNRDDWNERFEGNNAVVFTDGVPFTGQAFTPTPLAILLAEDIYEQNDTLATAADIAVPFFDDGLGIDSDEENDYYRLDLTNSGTLDIAVVFSHAAGDIDLELLDANGVLLQSATSATDNESIAREVVAGTYHVRVFGFGEGSCNQYALDITQAVAPAAIEVIKTADPTELVEPGGNVTFSFRIRNLSALDTVTIETLTDSLYGDLDGQGNCAAPQSIATGESYGCSITRFLRGARGGVVSNVLTVTGVDQGRNPVSGSDDAEVAILPENAQIAVSKEAAPTVLPEPGGPVTFTLVVTNLANFSDITLTGLVDDLHGDLDGQGSCSLPQTLAEAGGTYGCSFTRSVIGNAGDVETGTVTASALDAQGNEISASDDAQVAIRDQLPVIDLTKEAAPTMVDEGVGGDVTFAVTVTNTSPAEEIALIGLSDSLYGNLDGQGDCTLPQSIAANAAYRCAFTQAVTGNGGDSQTNTLTATAADDEGNQVSARATAIVTVADLVPEIGLAKGADPTTVDELVGGPVTFSLVVTNLSAVEEVILTSLDDSRYGDLDGQGDCSLPQALPAQRSYACRFAQVVTGNGNTTETNRVTAAAEDDEGNRATASAEAAVRIEDLPPAIGLVKAADPASVPEILGGEVTFSLTVSNLSAVEEVTLTSLSDSLYGDLDGQGDCRLPQDIAAGGSYGCAFGRAVNGNGGDILIDTVTATAEDDEQNQAVANAEAAVQIEDLLPQLQLTKEAAPGTLLEPGGEVTFTLTVRNGSQIEDLTLTRLYGDLDGAGDCVLPQSIAAGERYGCAFTRVVTGNGNSTQTNRVTATGQDDEGNRVEAAAEAQVAIGDRPPALRVAKEASPTLLVEPGGEVTFTLVVSNLSAFEEVTLVGLADSLYGDLDGRGDCLLPQTIPAGGDYGCAFVAEVNGIAGDVETDEVVATGEDDEGNRVSAVDTAAVSITDLPIVTIEVTADTAAEEGPETGEFVLVRSGGDGAALTVYYRLSGTANNGADYPRLPDSARFAAGESVSEPRVVTPIDDDESEGFETVEVSLAASASYAIGDRDAGIVTILDNDPEPFSACPDTAKDWTLRAYVGYYDRCGDFPGFQYWCLRLVEEGDGSDLSSIIAGFGTSQEYLDRFGAFTDPQLIDHLYQSMFDRAAEPEGMAYYLARLEDLRRQFVPGDPACPCGRPDPNGPCTSLEDCTTQWALSHIALDILNGAQGDDRMVLEERIGACPRF